MKFICRQPPRHPGRRGLLGRCTYPGPLSRLSRATLSGLSLKPTTHLAPPLPLSPVDLQPQPPRFTATAPRGKSDRPGGRAARLARRIVPAGIAERKRKKGAPARQRGANWIPTSLPQKLPLQSRGGPKCEAAAMSLGETSGRDRPLLLSRRAAAVDSRPKRPVAHSRRPRRGRSGARPWKSRPCGPPEGCGAEAAFTPPPASTVFEKGASAHPRAGRARRAAWPSRNGASLARGAL